MDEVQKQLVLRYAQLTFKKELGQNGSAELEKEEIRNKLGMEHDAILRLAAEKIVEKFE